MMAGCEASHSAASSGSLYCNLNICFWREIIGNYGRVDRPHGVREYYYLQPFALCRHPVAVDFYIMRNVELRCGAWQGEAIAVAVWILCKPLSSISPFEWPYLGLVVASNGGPLVLLGSQGGYIKVNGCHWLHPILSLENSGWCITTEVSFVKIFWF